VIAHERPELRADRAEVGLGPLDREARLGDPEPLVVDAHPQVVLAELDAESWAVRLDERPVLLDGEPWRALLCGRGPGGKRGERDRDDGDSCKTLHEILPTSMPCPARYARSAPSGRHAGTVGSGDIGAD
jgi:hypothetical protein